MSDPAPRSSPMGPWIGTSILSLLVVVIGYFGSEHKLLSRRPELRSDFPAPIAFSGATAMHARLWQDPLELAYKDSEKKHARDKLLADLNSVAKSTDDFWTKQREIVQEHFKGRFGSKDRNQPSKDQARPGNNEAPPGNDQTQTDTVICLPVLLRGGISTDAGEDRLRTTHAVYTALAAEEFGIESPERMAYIEMPVYVHHSVFDRPPVEVRFAVPYKTVTTVSGATKTTVILCWIDGDRCGRRPLFALTQILDWFFDKETRRKINLHIIGPSTSDVLKNMARENENWNKATALFGKVPSYGDPAEWADVYDTFKSSHLCSPMATLAPESESDLRTFLAVGPKSCKLDSVTRTIGTDLDLITALKDELALRGVLPDRRESNDGLVAIVTEHDSTYGHQFLRLFKDRVTGDNNWLRAFTYLRGLDGKLAGENTGQKLDSEKERPFGNDLESLLYKVEELPAAGQSQVDYLRRLAAKLKELDLVERQNGRRGVKAVGVVGTDVYDKLLVLRALRKDLPEAQFFTTDLDAELCRPSELPATRNLLVATHFGLELNPFLQRNAFPFRDSYQTSTYLAVRWVLSGKDGLRLENRVRGSTMLSQDDLLWGVIDADHSDDRAALTPLLFEIGRHACYQLTRNDDHASQNTLNPLIHPQSRRIDNLLTPLQHVGLFVLAVVGIIFVWLLNPSWFGFWSDLVSLSRNRVTRIYAIVAAIVVSSAAILLPFCFIRICHVDSRGEPFSLTEGISIWPSTLLLWVAGLFAVCMASFVRNRLRKKALNPDLNASRSTVHWKDVREALNGRDWGKHDTSTGDEVCDTYDKKGRPTNRKWAALAFSMAFGLLAVLPYMISLNTFPWAPSRGTAGSVHFLIQCLAVSACAYLTFYVVHAQQLCSRFVKTLAEQRRHWTPEKIASLEIEWPRPIATDLNAIDDLVTIRIIGRLTRIVGELIHYPITVMLLITLSYATFFDDWFVPWPWWIWWGILPIIVYWKSYQLARDASRARGKIVRRVTKDLLELGQGENYDNLVRQITQLRNDILAEDDGAFGPFIKSPLFSALAIPLSGTSGLVLLQYFFFSA